MPKSARFHGLFCLKTSAASASGAKACANRISSAKTFAALVSESATPTNFKTAAMCAWYFVRKSAALAEGSR